MSMQRAPPPPQVLARRVTPTDSSRRIANHPRPSLRCPSPQPPESERFPSCSCNRPAVLAPRPPPIETRRLAADHPRSDRWTAWRPPNRAQNRPTVASPQIRGNPKTRPPREPLREPLREPRRPCAAWRDARDRAARMADEVYGGARSVPAKSASPSALPAVFAEEWHKSHRGEILFLELFASTREQVQHLLIATAERNQKSSTLSELLDVRGRNHRSCRSDKYRVVWRELRPAKGPVAQHE